MTAPTPDPTTASVGEQIAQAIEAKCMGSHRQGTGLCPECADAARIARNFTPTVDGATVDEAAVRAALADLPRRTREVREARGLSLRGAAKEIDMDFNTLTRFERGRSVETRHLPKILDWITATVPTSPTDTGGESLGYDGQRDPAMGSAPHRHEWGEPVEPDTWRCPCGATMRRITCDGVARHEVSDV